jgi:hypothetical protein
MMDKKKQTTIAIGGDIRLEKHEVESIDFLKGLGKSITLIPNSKTKNQESADIIMDGAEWEIKSPIGKGKRNLENTLKKASHQAPNIIIDLRRNEIPESKIINRIKRITKLRSRIKKLYVITKSEEFVRIK